MKNLFIFLGVICLIGFGLFIGKSYIDYQKQELIIGNGGISEINLEIYGNGEYVGIKDNIESLQKDNTAFLGTLDNLNIRLSEEVKKQTIEDIDTNRRLNQLEAKVFQ